jgi:RNA polymerase sigma factor (sigma-70 family)
MPMSMKKRAGPYVSKGGGPRFRQLRPIRKDMRMVQDDLFCAYQRERDPRVFALLVERYTPLVRSVCRRYLYLPEDQEDATQVVFTKLAQHVEEIHGCLSAWLSATAHSTSMDLIRRTLRDRSVVGQYGWVHRGRGSAAGQRDALRQALLRTRLDQAIADLDAPTQQLIRERFFRQQPLRSIARTQRLSVATASRRVQQALHDLTVVLKARERSEGDSVAWGGGLAEAGGDHDARDGMRFARDWSTLAPRNPRQNLAGLACPYLPGWTRPIRAGVVVSYQTILYPAAGTGVYMGIEDQLRSTRLIVNPAFELVGIVEPGTECRPCIERVVRDFELTAGLIDATDEEGLRSLDVIVFGGNFHIEPRILDTLSRAIRSGVGFYKEWWLAADSINNDPRQQALLLAGSPIGHYHTRPVHGMPVPATVVAGHPILAGIGVGTSLRVDGCGPVYKPAPEATVLVTKDRLFEPHEHQQPALGPAHQPVMLAGPCGRGRIVAMHLNAPDPMANHPRLQGDYMTNILTWLAEPRKE